MRPPTHVKPINLCRRPSQSSRSKHGAAPSVQCNCINGQLWCLSGKTWFNTGQPC